VYGAEPGKAPPMLAGMDRFDLKIERSADDLVTAHLSFPAEAQDGDADDVEAISGRLQLDTGDLQVRIKAKELPLHPYRAVFPKWIEISADTVLRDTDVRIIYGADVDQVEVHGAWHVDKLAASMPRMALETMRDLSIGGKTHAVMDLKQATVTVKDSSLRLGDVPMTLSLGLEDLNKAPLISWNLDVPRVGAQKVIDALPAAFLGELDGMRVSGDIGWSLQGTLDTRDMRSLAYKSKPQAHRFRVHDLGEKIDFSTLKRRFAYRVHEKGGKTRERKTGPGAGGWVPLRAVSPWMAKVLTTTEDGTFWRHKGMAFFAIKDAIIDNLEKGRFYRGASTLTQQLVKNVFLDRKKTIGRKARELFLAWRLESYLNKDTILSLYLNIVELGPNIYGIKRAARYYFDKTPANLDIVECAFLASILPNPRKFHYLYRRGKVTENWRKGLERIIAVMHKRGKVSEREMKAAAPFSPAFVKRKRRGRK